MSLGDLTPAEFKAQIGTTHRRLGESQRASFSSNQWSEETGHVNRPNPVLSKNPIDAVRRADSTLDAHRVATFVTAESLC